jgi:RNA polymerase sigma factor (sigma-70 family)
MRRYDVADDVLLRQVAGGDEAALRELFDRHAAWLQLRLQRRTSQPDLAADALQDTFVAVWRGAASYRGDGDVGGWLWGIAVRRLVSRLRARRGDAPAPDDLIAHLSPLVQSAEDQLLVGVEYGDVGAALRSLSPELRTVVQATVIDGLTTREAAGLLGIPQGTVKTRMRAAKAQLRGRLVTTKGALR